jgi:hypothetical protein
MITGCSQAPASPPVFQTSAVPSATELKPARVPAAMAGGACQLLDYDTVEQMLGMTFEVAAGGQQDATHTCVLQQTGTSVPDLALAVTPSNADPTIFRSTVAPKGSAVINGLGRAGYQAGVAPPADSGRGAGVEVGWLSGNKRILVLRATLTPEATPETAQELGPKLVELAKKVDQIPT